MPVEDPIIVVPYDPAWPAAFEAEARRIASALGSAALRIDHVGSTSVPGLTAKPVIDIQVSVRPLHPLEPYLRPLSALGYTHVPHPDDATYPFLHRPSRWPHSHHVHLCEAGGSEERRNLAFRDFLRGHPEQAAAYAEEKRRLARRFSAASFESRNAYAEAKSRFIEPIVERALGLGVSRRSEPVSRRYILWDHDGVLVDTERWYFAATRDVLAGVGIELSQATYLEYSARGQSCWDLCRAGGMSDREVARCRELRNASYQEFLRSQPIELDGVAEVLGALSASFEMAVVTTSRREDFELIHRSRDLLAFFRFVLTVEDCRRAKPHPDPYLAGLERFGARPEQTVAIEDSARGLRSARDAGLDCLVVRSEFTASQDFSEAWRVVDSIRQVPGILAGEA